MAGVTRINSYPDYSSSGTAAYVPEVWSGKLIEKFYATTCFGEIASTEYESEIKSFGDNIIIRTVPDVTVSDYNIGSAWTQADYEAPLSAKVELPINKAKAFKLKINTVDRAQSDLDLAEVFANEASMRLHQAMDKDVLGNIFSQVAAENSGATAGVISEDLDLGTGAAPLAINEDNAVEAILRVGQVLDEQNVSEEGRWIVLPAWYVRVLKNSILRDAKVTGDSQSPLRNGRVGTIDRFTIFQSNHLTVTDPGGGGQVYTNIVAGHPAGLAWASQITEMERVPNPADFGHLMRGLCVYGYKVVEPKYLAWVRAFADNT